MNPIASQTRKIMANAIDRYAKVWNAPPENIQLMLKLHEDGIAYFLLRDYKVEKPITIMDVLGVRIDFKGFSLIAPPFIRKSMERMCGQYKVAPSDLSVIINKRPEVKMWAYNKSQHVGEVTFEYLFGDDI